MSDLGTGDDSQAARGSRAGDEDQLLDAGMRIAYDDADEKDCLADVGHTSVLHTLSASLGAAFSDIRLRDQDDSPIYLPRGGRVMGLNLPQQLGRYRVAGEIARGGVGVVYRARDEDLGRDVAIKVLHDDFRDHPEMTCRFVEEAQVGGQLQHPGIVPVHELGLVADKRPYFAMKLVKGETLSRLLERRGDPSEDRLRFLGIFEQICRPVAYAHTRGVIHRDLKPSNIMVGAFGEVQVMDWGLAKVLSHGGVADERVGIKERREISIIETVRSGSTGSASLAGSILGTLAYMPPEQARGQVESLDESSDVFGLGAILCEILTGEPPYTGSSLREIRRRAERGELAETLERLDACGADGEVVGLAKRCLALSPRERPRDGAAVVEEISHYLQSLEARARASQVQAAQAEIRTKAERKARRLTVALATSVVLALLVAAGAHLWLEREQREAAREAAARVHEASMRARDSLREARRLHADALASGAGREQWAAALEAARATRSLATDDVDPLLREEVDQFGLEVEREAKVRRFAARLRDIRDEPTLHFGTTALGIDQRYADAFRKFLGAHILDLPRPDAVDRLRASGIGRDISLALDDWALVRRKIPRSSDRIVEISLEVTPDHSRWRMWNILRNKESGDLKEVVESLPPGTVRAGYLCALAQSWQSDPAAETLVRRAVKVEPDSFRANALYGTLLQRAHRYSESLPYLAAARALRPRNPLVAFNLGVVRARLGDVDAAFELFARSFGVLPHSWVVTEPLRLLERDDVQISDAVLDDYIEAIRNLPEAETKVLRRVWNLLGAALAKRYGLDEAEKGITIAMCEVRRTGRRDPHILVMLARVQFATGERAAAVRTLEEAMSLPGATWMYGIRDEALLEEYRRAVLPEIVSYASVDAALRPEGGDAEARQLDTERLDDVRTALERQGASNHLVYLDGRRLQHSGDHTAAVERFRTTLATDRSAPEPFVRLWESLRVTVGVEAANREVREEIEKGVPAALIPIPPEVPVSLRAVSLRAVSLRAVSLRAVTEGSGVRLEASDFRSIDVRVRHASSRWEVRSENGEFGHTPVVDLNSPQHLTRLELPAHALEPRTRYLWRVSYIAATGQKVTSAEASFTTADYAFEPVPFDLSTHFNRDVIVNSGDDHNDTLDDGEGALVEDGFPGDDGPAVGMPPDRRVGVHRLADYDSLNVVQIAPSDTDAIRVEVPERHYAALRFLVSGGHGDSDVPLTLEYEDGTSERRAIRCDDWIDGPEGGLWGGAREAVQPVLDGMASFRSRSVSGRTYAVFEVTIDADPKRRLRAFVLHAGEMAPTYERTRFNLFAATGIVVGR